MGSDDPADPRITFGVAIPARFYLFSPELRRHPRLLDGKNGGAMCCGVGVRRSCHDRSLELR